MKFAHPNSRFLAKRTQLATPRPPVCESPPVWLLAALRCKGPYPLAISGEQGSAKSTLCKLLRALPPMLPRSARSREERERDRPNCTNGIS
jgi:hypothetical protein